MKKPSTRDRGEFRAFFTAMIDDPGFPELDPFAFKLLFALKLNLSAVGIGILRPGTLMDCLGCTAEQLEAGLAALAKPKPDSTVGWILREKRVVWVINGLHFETYLYPKNPKHRAFIGRTLKALGDCGIVEQFSAYYSDWFEEAPTIEGVSEGYRRGIEGPSDQLQKKSSGNNKDLTTQSLSRAREQLPGPFRADYDELLERVKESKASTAAWAAEILAAPDGHANNGVKRTPPSWIQIGQAIRDYNASGAKPSLAHFRGYLRRATAEPRAEHSPAGGSVRSRGKRNAGEESLNNLLGAKR